MNLKNRVLSGLLAVVACSSFLNIAAFAAGEPTVKLNSSTNVFKPGDEITLNFDLENNPGIISMFAEVAWDDSVVLESVTDVKVIPNSTFSDSYSTNPYILSWANDLAKTDYTQNGTWAELKFKVADSAVAGTKHTIKLTPDTTGGVYNVDLDDVIFTANSFDYTIASASKPATAIKLDKSELTIYLNGDKKDKITATVEPTDTTDTITWKSEDKNIADVDENGIVTAFAEGETTITATIGNLDPVSCKVIVTTDPIKDVEDVEVKGDYGKKTLKYVANILKYVDATSKIKVTKTFDGKTADNTSAKTIAELLDGVANDGTYITADVAIGVLTADKDAVFSFGLDK